MNIVIQKFIDFLKEKQNISSSFLNREYILSCHDDGTGLYFGQMNKLSDRIKDDLKLYQFEFILLSDLIVRLETPNKELSVEWEPFNEFIILSDLLEESQLNIKDKLKVLEYIIAQNFFILSCNIKFQVLDIFYELKRENKVTDAYYKNNKKTIFKLFNKKELTTEESLIRAEIVKRTKTDKLTTILTRLNNTFLDKKDNYNEKDIEEIIKLFLELGVSKNLCESFRIIFNSDLEKRNKKSQSVVSKLVLENTKNTSLSMFEYNNIIKEIEQYYDIQSQSVIRPLTLDEIIYLVNLFFKARFEKSEIINRLAGIYKYQGYAYPDLLKEFLAYQDKIKYSKNAFVKEDYETIKSYLKELVQIQDEESYIFWKQAIEDEYKKLSQNLVKEYDYELEESQKLNIKR